MSVRSRRAYAASAAAPGDRLALDPEESHHVARVLRLRAGDALRVFDGAGREWEAAIEAVAKENVTVVLGPEIEGRIDPTFRVVLWQANVRPERLEWVLEKGTEIGVAEFRLFASERVEAPPPSPARWARYRRILVEACKQCGRRVVPTLLPGELTAADPGLAAIVLAPGAAPLREALRSTPPGEAWLAVGPEGGLTEGEIESLTRGGWRAASLGPRVLRTETAGLAAAAVVLNEWGDLGRI